MAHAPRPGSTRPPKRVALSITYGGDTYMLDFSDIGPRDDIAARKATGLPVSSFLSADTFSSDTIAVLIWVARRKSGIRESFDQFLDSFPSMGELPAMLESGAIAVSAVDDEPSEGDGSDEGDGAIDPFGLGGS